MSVKAEYSNGVFRPLVEQVRNATPGKVYTLGSSGNRVGDFTGKFG